MRKVLWVIAVLVLVSGAAWADLCPQCRGQMFTPGAGMCRVCQKPTASYEFTLCADCSKKLNQCMRCRKPLPAAAEADPTAVAKFDSGASCTYMSGKWKYAYLIRAKGTKSEGRSGVLTYDGKAVEAALNDRIQTPWGMMQYFGQRGPADPGWGDSGWLVKRTYDKPIDAKKGNLLPAPGDSEISVGRRTEALKGDLDNFVLSLKFHGRGTEPRYWLTLWRKPQVRSAVYKYELTETLDEDTALKIINWLAKSDGLAHATDLNATQPDKAAPPQGPRYMLYVSSGSASLECDLGWEMPLLRELLRLRALLTGDAAKQMDVFMGHLSDDIKTWTGKPYEPPK